MRVAFVAVAVKAIISTFSGTTLLASPMVLNSFLKYSYKASMREVYTTHHFLTQ
jgi:Na+/proline symporter